MKSLSRKTPRREPRKHLRGDPKGLLGRWGNWRAKLILSSILLLAAFLRFYKLDWGEGHFFHPDEYHISAAVDRLSFPGQMNPKLFSYGSLSVYLIYFTRLFLSLISFPSLSPILIGRFYSALFSTLTILLIYSIAKKLFVSLYLCILVSFLVATLPGSIQQAHFTTPESILTFWLFFTLLMSLNFLKTRKNKYLYLAAASQGLALGTKTVALTFLPIVFLPPLIFHFSPSEEVGSATTSECGPAKRGLLPARNASHSEAGGRGEYWKQSILSALIILSTFFLSFPYAFLDWQSMRNTWNYETGLARGKLAVFYTRQFINTTPIIFQFKKIFPYALGPGVMTLGCLGFLGCLWYLGKSLKKKKSRFSLLILISFLSYFLPNAFLFTKWTRFMAPIFPFFAIFSVYFLSLISKKKLLSVIGYLLIMTTILQGLMFFSVYLKPDIRITATNWLNQNLEKNATILVEGGNMLDVPLDSHTFKRISFDFYALEDNSQKEKLITHLVESDYFIIQSRRIFANHQHPPNQFPITANFYDLLFTNQLGFEKIKQFNSLLTLRVSNVGSLKIKINDENAEETWSVFDHPVIRVYKKVKPLTAQDYKQSLMLRNKQSLKTTF